MRSPMSSQRTGGAACRIRLDCIPGTISAAGRTPTSQGWLAIMRSRASVFGSFIASKPQISAARVFIVEQGRAGVGQRDTAVLQHDATIGDGERVLHILLNQQDRQPLFIEAADDAEDLSHD